MQDLENWWPKVKKDGYLTGHDYEVYEIKRFGVFDAVNLFCKKYNLQIAYLSDMHYADWAIKK
jgi:hypothetical protein